MHSLNKFAFPFSQDSVTLFNLTSTFGMRIRTSCQCDDFHRGIDLDAPIGTPIFAPADGKFYGIRTYSSGGLTLRMKHEFVTRPLYKGKTRRYFYIFLMHLSSIPENV